MALKSDAPERATLRQAVWRPVVAAADFTAYVATVARSTLTPPFIWRRALVDEIGLTITRCALPLAVSAAFLSVATNLTLATGALRPLGGDDRVGGVAGVLSLREFGAWVTGMVIAGVAGTAICSDLGARRVREELDALAVLGVDVLRLLVVPRALAVAIVSPFMYLWGVFWLTGTAWAVGPALVGLDRTAFVATFQTILGVDVWAGMVKLAIIGLITGLVSCHYGLTASGGPEGVGRNVNRAVVVCFAATWIISLLFNTTYLAAFPHTQDLR